MFEQFNFKNFKKILYPLLIIALLMIIKYIIYSNPAKEIEHAEHGLLGLLQYFESSESRFSPLQIILLDILDIFVLMVLFSWEAFYEKKYNKIPLILLCTIPQYILAIIILKIKFTSTFIPATWNIVYFLIFPYATYGLVRLKFLKNGKLSIAGYLIGLMFVFGNQSLIYTAVHKLFSVFYLYTPFLFVFKEYLYSLFSTSLVYVMYFYLIFLSDNNFSLSKFFIPQKNTIPLNKPNFTFHFISLFTFYFFIILGIIVSLQNFGFSFFSNGDIPPFLSISKMPILYIVPSVLRLFSVLILYSLFSRLLLEQLDAISRKPLWGYLFSFIPLTNLIPLFKIYHKQLHADTVLDQIKKKNKEDKRRRAIQVVTIILALIYALIASIKQFNNEAMAVIIAVSVTLIAYIALVSVKKGYLVTLSITFLLLLIACILIPWGSILFISLWFLQLPAVFNIHRAIFWGADEPILSKNTEQNTNTNN